MSKKQVGGFAFSSGGAAPRRADASAAGAAPRAGASTVTASAEPAAAAKTQGNKRLRLEDGFVPSVDIEACWPRGEGADHVRLLQFLDEAGQRHTAHVREALGDTYPYVEGAVTTLYNGFLASCRQYIADDAKAAETQLTANPKNVENAGKEAAASHQIARYKEELRQWEQLAKQYGPAAAGGGAGSRRGKGAGGKRALDDEEQDEGKDGDKEGEGEGDDGPLLDPELLKRFPLAAQLDRVVASSVSSAVLETDKVTQAVRVVKRQLRVAEAGVKVAASQAREAAGFGSLPEGKQVLKALLGGGGAGKV